MTNNINLDKVCAEYGMDLLSLPKKLYEITNKIIKDSSNLNDFKNKNYTWNDNENNCKEFVDYDLVNPLKTIQNKIREENNFSKLRSKENSLTFDSKTFEIEITKALGILVEDGPFAYMIWLKSQDKESHRAMLIQTARILKELGLIQDIENNDNLKEKLEEKFLNSISSDLTKTLFVKTILEKMLIYARYKAKAMQHE